MITDDSGKNNGTAQLDTFQEKLAENNIDSIVIAEENVSELLEEIITRPAVASVKRSNIELPDYVDTDPTFTAAKVAETGITPALLAIVSHGSVVIPSTEEMEGPVSLWPPHHIVILRQDDIVLNIGDALELLTEYYRDGISDTVIVSGPSVTGDMGGRVTGVHGPMEMEVLIIE